MSSNYSAEDLDAIVELANTVQKHYIDVPDQYKAILDDVKRLPKQLRETEDGDSDDSLGEQTLNDITKGCRDLLQELNAYLGYLSAKKALSKQYEGGPVDFKTTIGETVLLLAAKQGFKEIVRFLLDQGVSPDPKDRAGRTPLHHAVAMDHTEVVKMLLKAGGDIETTDLADHIPLMFAAPCGNDEENRSGHTPLISAIEGGNKAMVKLLLEAGADPDHYTDDYVPLISAIRTPKMEIFTLLLDKVSDLDHVDGRGETPLMHAAGWHNRMGELLLERGARLDVENKYGETAMSIASRRANEPLLRLLLGKIPGQEYVNAKGQGLLHFAAGSDLEGGDEAMVRFLLAREGLTRDRKVADAQSGLHGAAWKGYTTILDILLGIDGVDVDSKDEDGYTALWLAVRWGREDAVELLLDKYGASLDVPNGDMEWTAFQAAIYYEKPETARMLLARGANPNSRDRYGRSPLSWAVNIEWDDCHDGIGSTIVPLLLETDGVDVNSQDKMGRTPLFWALLSAIYLVHAPEKASMYEDGVQLLLEKGARVDSRDDSGRTPIFYAAMVKRAALVQMFLDKGAEPDCKDADGRTPLSYAVEPFNVTWLAEYKEENEDEWEPDWSCDQLSKVVQTLLAKGSDPFCQDTKGLTPLSRAEKKLEKGNEVLVLLRDTSGRGLGL
ncbi:ankyrin repeat-containing domain protein [Aspergillus pseudocaelatus]|uniref:Ankyrin repeat-containing domain protein n=1 Tax=Aspergillus pseudocaelatus TaxID=1825620 RepID=A0ABQ6X3Z1_9EURO|nr:ankyrin repeat-containing domain protein [Aspergillus pseudocaelatus]